VHYESVAFEGGLTQAALAVYLRSLLSERGLAAKKLRVAIASGRATVTLGSRHAAMTARIVGTSSVKLVPLGGSAALAGELAAPIQLGPLPDGVRLTGVTLRAGRATITGGGRGGTIRA
jgi:hypothetical protein